MTGFKLLLKSYSIGNLLSVAIENEKPEVCPELVSGKNMKNIFFYLYLFSIDEKRNKKI